MTKREPISKTLRFKIFQRDSFTCCYCGSTPPRVVLEIDHLHPVSKGGDNSELNLITSCFDCNRGKGNRLITEIPDNRLEILKEKEDQLKEYNKQVKRRNKRIQKEIDTIDEIYSTHMNGWCLTDTFKQVSVRKFIDAIGIVEVKESMYIALGKGLHPTDTTKYFCGICNNKIKNG